MTETFARSPEVLTPKPARQSLTFLSCRVNRLDAAFENPRHSTYRILKANRIMSSNETFGLTDSDVRVALCALKVMLIDGTSKV